MKSGLQERVGLTEAGLLLDTLAVWEGDTGSPDTVWLTDTEREDVIEWDGVREKEGL